MLQTTLQINVCSELISFSGIKISSCYLRKRRLLNDVELYCVSCRVLITMEKLVWHVKSFYLVPISINFFVEQKVLFFLIISKALVIKREKLKIQLKYIRITGG